MNSFSVVERFDVLKDARSSLFHVFKGFKLRPFMLQRPEEPLHHRVVVATSSSTHGACDIHRFHLSLVFIAGVLAPAVGRCAARRV